MFYSKNRCLHKHRFRLRRGGGRVHVKRAGRLCRNDCCNKQRDRMQVTTLPPKGLRRVEPPQVPNLHQTLVLIQTAYIKVVVQACVFAFVLAPVHAQTVHHAGVMLTCVGVRKCMWMHMYVDACMHVWQGSPRVGKRVRRLACVDGCVWRSCACLDVKSRKIVHRLKVWTPKVLHAVASPTKGHRI